MGLFDEQFEQEAIVRIRKFERLANKMGFEPVLGFSGGKDSQVCYDLCKRAGIKFRAVFNHCFETAETMRFIRKYYPDVEWRREVKQGFFENIRVNHGGFLPTVEASYCCVDYKHNPHYVDDASIVGVRREESAKRAKRQVLETKNKRELKKNKALFTEYFKENCIASGSPSEITLFPIVDWGKEEVWNYIKKHRLPINPAYAECDRVGCIICPKANFTSNCKALLKYPKLIDAAIKARVKSNNAIDWYITGDKMDYADRQPEYICRWLNHSFRPFTKKQTEIAKKVIGKYNKMHNI